MSVVVVSMECHSHYINDHKREPSQNAVGGLHNRADLRFVYKHQEALQITTEPEPRPLALRSTPPPPPSPPAAPTHPPTQSLQNSSLHVSRLFLHAKRPFHIIIVKISSALSELPAG